jgi:hypothetical protein
MKSGKANSIHERSFINKDKGVEDEDKRID